MASTLKAMKRVQEIQQVREKRFYEKRYELFECIRIRMALAKEQLIFLFLIKPGIWLLLENHYRPLFLGVFYST